MADSSPPSSSSISSGTDGGDGKPCLVPRQVQIVDVENHMDGLRPYNVYVIVIKKGEGGK